MTSENPAMPDAPRAGSFYRSESPDRLKAEVWISNPNRLRVARKCRKMGRRRSMWSELNPPSPPRPPVYRSHICYCNNT